MMKVEIHYKSLSDLKLKVLRLVDTIHSDEWTFQSMTIRKDEGGYVAEIIFK